jgi:hydrogenase expression/formation protein HypE
VKEDLIVMAHGGGGGMTKRLVRDIVLREVGNPVLDPLDDAACFASPGAELVMTTDSYVVHPIFFPGGDIGRLAVCGTVNDLAMQGGRPVYLSLALILEEGLPVRDLERVIRSAGEAAREAGVLVVTGDTKVVERRRREPGAAAPGLYVNTTGIGVRPPGVDTAVAHARPGDAVIVSGTLGDHGVAVLCGREGLELSSGLESDVAPLAGMVGALLDAVPGVHCLRDPTRGGLAAAVCDIAEASGCAVRLRESDVPVRPEVRGACDLLGLEPLNVANEGKAVVVCPAADAGRALEILRSHPAGRHARAIGEVTAGPEGMAILHTAAGGERIVVVPSGEDLPRIC